MKPIRLLVAACALGACVSANADWAQFQGPTRDGKSPEKGLLKSWSAGGPKTVWSIPVGEGYGAASVRDGEVYLLDRQDDKVDVLRCLALDTGKELWNYTYESPGSVSHNGSRTPPTIDEKYVYSVGVMGDFLCLDRKTHKPVWQKNILKEFNAEMPNWGVSQAPVLYKNLVITCPQAADAFVVAFEKETGKVVWKTPNLGKAGYLNPVLMTLAGVEQLVLSGASNKSGSEKGLTVGLSLADGKPLWQYDGWQCFITIPNPTQLPGDQLFITGGYNAGSAIVQIKKTDKGLEAVEVKKLDAKVVGSQIQQPIVHKDHIFVGNNSNERELGLSCFTLDGTLKWSTKQPSLERGDFILADDMFIGLDGKSGVLYLFEPSTEGYKELAQAKVLSGKELWAPMALVNGKLILRSQDTMKCLDLKQS